MNQRELSGMKVKLTAPELALLKAGTTDMRTTANLLDVAEKSGSLGFWRTLRYEFAGYRLQKAGYISRYPEGWYTLTPSGVAFRDALHPD